MAVIDTIEVNGINYDVNDTDCREDVSELQADAEIATSEELIQALYS